MASYDVARDLAGPGPQPAFIKMLSLRTSVPSRSTHSGFLSPDSMVQIIGQAPVSAGGTPWGQGWMPYMPKYCAPNGSLANMRSARASARVTGGMA